MINASEVLRRLGLYRNAPAAALPEFSRAEAARLEEAGKLILAAEDRLPVLGSIAWGRGYATAFFESGEKELPQPAYEPIDPGPSLEAVKKARTLIDGSSPVHDWLTRLCDMSDTTARMLAAVGTAEFHEHSRALYGGPSTPIADGVRTALDLAQTIDDLLSDIDEGSLLLEPAETLTAEDLKARLDEELPQYFGDAAPSVTVTDDVSAKASASRTGIKIRDDAVFSDLDAIQLLHHEALIHIVTGLNGDEQTRFPILAESHPGNARTQEGLAVFSEFLSGAIDPHRFRRLANRCIAIDMAQNGADFIDLYKFFRKQSERDSPFEAFESARRVVRGGLVTGGAPFTKDSVYLGGLLEVHTFLRSAIAAGDTATIRLIFVGKIDLTDLEAARILLNEGLISEPRFLPPWATDLRYLMSYLAYSTFLNQIDMRRARTRFEDLLEDPAESG